LVSFLFLYFILEERGRVGRGEMPARKEGENRRLDGRRRVERTARREKKGEGREEREEREKKGERRERREIDERGSEGFGREEKSQKKVLFTNFKFTKLFVACISVTYSNILVHVKEIRKREEESVKKK
jgi:hypothetical protein